MADEPAIFIDEDWKAQVQREKEQAAQAEPEGLPASVEPADAVLADSEVEEENPPASLETLVASLATQAMLSLGLVPQRGQEQVYIDLDSAKYAIDMLGILRDKTKGNLTPQEEGTLLQAISEMEEVYIIRVQQYQEYALQQAGIDPRNLTGK